MSKISEIRELLSDHIPYRTIENISSIYKIHKLFIELKEHNDEIMSDDAIANSEEDDKYTIVNSEDDAIVNSEDDGIVNSEDDAIVNSEDDAIVNSEEDNIVNSEEDNIEQKGRLIPKTPVEYYYFGLYYSHLLKYQ